MKSSLPTLAERQSRSTVRVKSRIPVPSRSPSPSKTRSESPLSTGNIPTSDNSESPSVNDKSESPSGNDKSESPSGNDKRDESPSRIPIRTSPIKDSNLPSKATSPIKDSTIYSKDKAELSQYKETIESLQESVEEWKLKHKSLLTQHSHDLKEWTIGYERIQALELAHANLVDENLDLRREMESKEARWEAERVKMTKELNESKRGILMEKEKLKALETKFERFHETMVDKRIYQETLDRLENVESVWKERLTESEVSYTKLMARFKVLESGGGKSSSMMRLSQDIGLNLSVEDPEYLSPSRGSLSRQSVSKESEDPRMKQGLQELLQKKDGEIARLELLVRNLEDARKTPTDVDDSPQGLNGQLNSEEWVQLRNELRLAQEQMASLRDQVTLSQQSLLSSQESLSTSQESLKSTQLVLEDTTKNLVQMTKERNETAESLNAAQQELSTLSIELEKAVVDREIAEEKLLLKVQDMDQLTLDVSILNEELSLVKDQLQVKANNESTESGRTVVSNSKLMSALMHLSMVSQMSEAGLKSRVLSLEEQLSNHHSLDGVDPTLIISGLKSRLDEYAGSDSVISRLSEQNLDLEEKLVAVESTLEHIEALNALNEEIHTLRVDQVKSLLDECDGKDRMISELGRRMTLQTENVADLERDLKLSSQQVSILKIEVERLGGQKSNVKIDADILVVQTELTRSEVKAYTRLMELELSRFEKTQLTHTIDLIKNYLPADQGTGGFLQTELVELHFILERIVFKAELVIKYSSLSPFEPKRKEEGVFQIESEIIKVSCIDFFYRLIGLFQLWNNTLMDPWILDPTIQKGGDKEKMEKVWENLCDVFLPFQAVLERFETQFDDLVEKATRLAVDWSNVSRWIESQALVFENLQDRALAKFHMDLEDPIEPLLQRCLVRVVYSSMMWRLIITRSSSIKTVAEVDLFVIDSLGDIKSLLLILSSRKEDMRSLRARIKYVLDTLMGLGRDLLTIERALKKSIELNKPNEVSSILDSFEHDLALVLSGEEASGLLMDLKLVREEVCDLSKTPLTPLSSLSESVWAWRGLVYNQIPLLYQDALASLSNAQIKSSQDQKQMNLLKERLDEAQLKVDTMTYKTKVSPVKVKPTQVVPPSVVEPIVLSDKSPVVRDDVTKYLVSLLHSMHPVLYTSPRLTRQHDPLPLIAEWNILSSATIMKL